MSLSDDIDYNAPLSQNEHHQKLNEHSKHTSIAHLNIQAIVSTFNEFVMILQEYQLDIVALSEMGLQDFSFEQNCVQINGYNSVFRNRIGKRGGGVGIYIKESITYKVRHNLLQRHDNLEILFIEIGGRNKNTPSLICVAYQQRSNEIERLEWFENSENLLANVCLKWKGVSSLLVILILTWWAKRVNTEIQEPVTNLFFTLAHHKSYKKKQDTNRSHK